MRGEAHGFGAVSKKGNRYSKQLTGQLQSEAVCGCPEESWEGLLISYTAVRFIRTLESPQLHNCSLWDASEIQAGNALISWQTGAVWL